MAIIIPKEILDKTGAKEGDTLKLLIPNLKQKQREAIKKMAGIAADAAPFERDKRDPDSNFVSKSVT